MKLYLIRHTAVATPKGMCYGQTDVPLATSFYHEAQTVKAALSLISFDYVYTSPLSRCTRLADFCGFDLAMRDVRLQELNFGTWEGQNWDAINDPQLVVWYQDWLHTSAAEGESLIALYQRFLSFLQDLPKQAEKIAIFTHGGIISCARVYAGLTTFQRLFENTPPFGSIMSIALPKKTLNYAKESYAVH